jgi:hypothetical protein
MDKIPEEFQNFGTNGLYEWMKMVIDISAQK